MQEQMEQVKTGTFRQGLCSRENPLQQLTISKPAPGTEYGPFCASNETAGELCG
jgi:hypothetical protein